jgi:hypothetical protein
MSNPIHVIKTRMPRETLAALLGRPWADYVKFVADVDRRVLAVGGELHVDGEAELLERVRTIVFELLGEGESLS